MYEDIIELVGTEPGPTSMILVGVHGNEKCGIDAVNKLFPSLKIQAGRVLIGYGNPKAIKENVRFTDANLNRLFKSEKMLSEKEKTSYEYSRANFLKSYLNQADALLDIHASLTPESRRFIICEKNAENIVKYLPFSLRVSGFDDVEPGGTDYYMNQLGKIGICVECGYFNDSNSIETAEKTIEDFLVAQGHVAGTSKLYEQSRLQIQGIYLTKSDSFALTRPFKDFEELSENDLVGVDGDSEVRMPIDGSILFARNRNKINEEAFLYGQYKNKV